MGSASFERTDGSKHTYTSNLFIYNSSSELYNACRNNNIAKYAKITDASAECQFTTNWFADDVRLKLGTGTWGSSTSSTISNEYFNTVYSSSDSYSALANGNGKTYTINGFQSYFESENTNAGKIKNGYSVLGNISTGQDRTLKWVRMKTTVTWTDPTFAINVVSNNTAYGTVSGITSVTVDKTTNVSKTFTATPKTNCHFVRWEYNSNNTYGQSVGTTYSINPSVTITINENTLNNFATRLNLKAIFEMDTAQQTNLYAGNDNIKWIYVGDTPVKQIYIGSTKIYG